MLLSGDDSSPLEEAMKEGKIDVSVIKVIIVGTAGVGKTCVYCLLMGLPPPDKRTSTKLAERPVRVIQIISEKEGEKWEEADLKQMVAKAVPILCKRLKRHAQRTKKDTKDEGVEGETGTKEAGSKAEAQEETEVLKPKKGALEIAIEEIVIELDQLVKEYQAEGQPIPDTQQLPLEKQAIQQLVKQYQAKGKPISDTQQQQLPLEKQAIYLTDSGGQQAFWDLAPIFMHGCSTIMFVHRLCDELGEKPLNDWYKDGNIFGCSQRATLTTAEVFKLMCQRIESGGKSKVIVIGTHKDLYEAKKQPKETIKDKNTKLEHCIPIDSKIYFNEAAAKVIFEVNTAEPKKEDEDIARALRKKISDSTQVNEVDKDKEKEARPIPVAWYVLQIVLEEVAKRLKREIFSITECENVAKELSFGPGEMKAALKFLDTLNIFFYKEDILPDVVFISSQVPLSCVTELVKKRYQLLDKSKNPSDVCTPTDELWKQFRDQAKITLKLLQDEVFQSHYKCGIFTEEKFLHMLKELLIVAPINRSFFCPSLLEMVEVDGFLKGKNIVTRIVHFPGGYAPPGVFCCAVCHLVSKANWKIREKDVVARNKITFAVKGRRVTFIDKCQYLAVSIAQKDAKPTLCKEINQHVSEAIEHALTITHKETTLFGLSFLCPCTDHEAIHPAAVEEEDGDLNLVCSKEHLISGTLIPEEKTWLKEQYSGTINLQHYNLHCYSYISAGVKSEPSIVDLSNKVLPRVSSKIELLAIQLGLENEFDTIKKNNPLDVHSQTLKVFEKWKNKDKNYTWGFLIEGLRSKAVGLHDLARELEDWLSLKR